MPGSQSQPRITVERAGSTGGMMQGVPTASPLHALPPQLAYGPSPSKNDSGFAKTPLICTVLSHGTLNV